MRSWYDDTPTSPFVNEEKRCAFKRPSYTGIPVLVSCIVLKGLLNSCLRAVSQIGLFLVILGLSLLLTVRVCTPSSPFPERTEFHGINVFWVLGSSSYWLVVDPLLHWMMYCLSACLLHNDWHHWIPLKVLGGALLALAIATD